MKLLKFHLLGCGSSMGVPIIGCSCAVCTSMDVRNHRLRTSALLEFDKGYFLIDPGPDFRMQALRFGLESCGSRSLCGVWITHTHSDHIAGIDDLRIFNFKQNRSIPVLLSRSSYNDIRQRYSYLIEGTGVEQSTESTPASLSFTILEYASGHVDFEGAAINYCTYLQGAMPVTGFRCGDLAYLTDIKEYGPEVVDFIQGVRWLFISAGSERMSRMHLKLEESVELAKSSGAQNTFFIHLNHEIDFLEWQNRLPTGMSLGYDGLSLDLTR